MIGASSAGSSIGFARVVDGGRFPKNTGPYTTVFNRYNRWSRRGLWQASVRRSGRMRRSPSAHHDRQSGGEGASFGERRPKRGSEDQAIGRSRGGRTTKIHALVDGEGRPRAFLLTGGNVADIKGAAPLLASIGPSKHTIADKGYDADHLRSFLEERGTTPVIPNKSNRMRRFPFDGELYRLRNVIERTFCRLKDFRAIATRYDKTARNFLAGLCLIAALCYWIN
jgi:transposase